MKVAISFTGLFYDILKGLTTLDTFDALMFGCARTCVFNDQGRMDWTISFKNEIKSRVPDDLIGEDRLAPRDCFDDALLKKYDSYIDGIRRLDEKDRVFFRASEKIRIGIYSDLKDLLLGLGHEVWLRGWRKIESEFDEERVQTALKSASYLCTQENLMAPYRRFFETFGQPPSVQTY